MRYFKISGLALICSYFLLATRATVALAQPTTRPVGSVRGTVTSEGDVPLSEMVVYLESPDESRVMPPPRAPARVSQKGAQFEPRLVIVTVGQSVEFPNDEDRPIEHNVFSNSPPKKFDLGLYKPGESKTVLFDKPGPVFLYCSIHRYMDGVIFVSPTPFTSRVQETGAYLINDIPPGNWIVKTWQRRKRFPELTVPLAVTASHASVVDLGLKRK